MQLVFEAQNPIFGPNDFNEHRESNNYMISFKPTNTNESWNVFFWVEYGNGQTTEATLVYNNPDEGIENEKAFTLKDIKVDPSLKRMVWNVNVVSGTHFNLSKLGETEVHVVMNQK